MRAFLILMLLMTAARAETANPLTNRGFSGTPDRPAD